MKVLDSIPVHLQGVGTQIEKTPRLDKQQPVGHDAMKVIVSIERQ